MARRAVKVMVILSTCLGAISGVLWVCGCVLNPWDHYVSVNESLHIGVWSLESNPRIVFFNNAEYGPYRGSLISLENADGSISPPREREAAFGDSWGIYYRYFQWSDSRLWTLMVSLWYPVILFAMVPLIVLARSFLRRRVSQSSIG